MPSWKTDPIYREIFVEIRALWDEVDEAVRPLLLRVEERSAPSRPSSGRTPAPENVWLYDDSGFRSASMLRREPHDSVEERDGFYRFGLVWFNVSRDRRRATLGYQLGPRVAGAISYEVVSEGESIFLMADTGSLTA